MNVSKPKLLPARGRSQARNCYLPCYPARKSDYPGGLTNDRVCRAWQLSPSRTSHKWPGFCESLLAAYRSIGRQRLSAWLASLSPQSSVHSPVSDEELGIVWHRSPGFVREHKRRPFESNMLALHDMDAPGFWLLISELDFRERLAAERREPPR
ncbi:MAG: hypothetical protein IID41_07235 [Planctomycetes bacterium]|nr:hypothetical protein [Planctomycetota bacterium]